MDPAAEEVAAGEVEEVVVAVAEGAVVEALLGLVRR